MQYCTVTLVTEAGKINFRSAPTPNCIHFSALTAPAPPPSRARNGVALTDTHLTDPDLFCGCVALCLGGRPITLVTRLLGRVLVLLLRLNCCEVVCDAIYKSLSRVYFLSAYILGAEGIALKSKECMYMYMFTHGVSCIPPQGPAFIWMYT